MQTVSTKKSMYHDSSCKQCKQQLDTLRALDFAIQETVLYLDAYPHCDEALQYYHHLICQRKELMAEYETKCRPLSMYGNVSTSEWNWVDQPWPWEPDAN